MDILQGQARIWKENGIFLYSYLKWGHWTQTTAAFSQAQARDICWGEILDPTPRRRR